MLKKAMFGVAFVVAMAPSVALGGVAANSYRPVTFIALRIVGRMGGHGMDIIENGCVSKASPLVSSLHYGKLHYALSIYERSRDDYRIVMMTIDGKVSRTVTGVAHLRKKWQPLNDKFKIHMDGIILRMSLPRNLG